MGSFQVNFVHGLPEEIRAERLDSNLELLLVFYGPDDDELSSFSKDAVANVELRDGRSRPQTVWKAP